VANFAVQPVGPFRDLLRLVRAAINIHNRLLNLNRRERYPHTAHGCPVKRFFRVPPELKRA
jgi:hypothetical protein